MKTQDFDIQAIQQKLKAALAEEKEIVFAYLHGSFVQENEFRDIDVGVYVNNSMALKVDEADFEISLCLRLERKLGLPVDVKILNDAPLSFRYHVTRGLLLLSRDDLLREDFLQRTWSEYFDFLPLSRIYYEELTRA